MKKLGYGQSPLGGRLTPEIRQRVEERDKEVQKRLQQTSSVDFFPPTDRTTMEQLERSLFKTDTSTLKRILGERSPAVVVHSVQARREENQMLDKCRALLVEKEELTKENQEIKRELEMLKAWKARIEDSFEREKKQAFQKRLELEGKITAKERQIEKFESENQQLQQNLQNQQAQVCLQLEELRQLKQKSDQIQQSDAEFNRKINEKDDVIQKLKAENAKIQEDREQNKNEVNKQIMELEETNRKLEQSQFTLVLQEQERARKDREQLRIQMEAELNFKDRQLVEKAQEVSEVRNGLQSDLNTAMNKLQKCENSRNELQEKLNQKSEEWKEERNQAQTRIRDLQEKVEQLLSKEQQWIQQLQQTDSDTQKNKQIEDLQDEVNGYLKTFYPNVEQT
eukprot:TRINITY_DN35320_c0_g1_i11.p1 TRINITY_DN35320_c0_g1~~TRINITY_DN35320_c0_g1_i11.p1  ORF type:complete len:396 (-),score=78.24 TRINITY_DN35320_c0_g1_i11:63-1250(-)